MMRFLVPFLSVVACAVLAAGCGDGDAPPSTRPPERADAPASVPPGWTRVSNARSGFTLALCFRPHLPELFREAGLFRLRLLKAARGARELCARVAVALPENGERGEERDGHKTGGNRAERECRTSRHETLRCQVFRY